jgi:hypothetical protein
LTRTPIGAYGASRDQVAGTPQRLKRSQRCVVLGATVRSSRSMTDDQPLRCGPRLSSVDGLREANIFDSLMFDPVAGVVHVLHTRAYIQILRSGMFTFSDPAFVGAVMLDDPVAMRIWVDATAARLSVEPPEEWITRGTPRRRPDPGG